MNIRLILKRSAQLLLVPMFALVVSCNEKDPDAISVGSVANAEGETISVLEVSSEGGEYIVYPSTDTWTVVSSADWCVPQKDECLTYTEDKSLELYIYPADHADYGMSSSETNRVAMVTFTYGAADYTFLVNQNNATNYITVLPNSKSIGYEQTDFSFVVIASAAFEVSTPASWVSCEVDATSPYLVNVSADENGSQSERSAEFTIYSADGTTATFSLTQEGRNPSYVKASVTNYTFAADAAAQQTITATHNLIETPTFAVSSSLDWCTVSVGSYDAATGKYSFSISTTANASTSARAEAVVTITATSGDGNTTVYDTFTVNQAGLDEPSISIGEATYTFDNTAQLNATIPFIADGTVAAKASASWITVGTTSTTGLTISLTANTTGAERTSTVTVSATRGGETVTETITIIQEGVELYLEVSEETIYVAAAGEEIIITATTNVSSTSWYKSADWCTGSAGKYEVSANDTGYERTTYISVMATLDSQTLVKTVKVVQACDAFSN